MTSPSRSVHVINAAATMAGSSRGRSSDSVEQMSGRRPCSSDHPHASARNRKSNCASSQMRAMSIQ